MSITQIDGARLYRMLTNGWRNLRRNVETVDDLNVFPVPDGDTGTNMSMTLGGGVRAASEQIAEVGELMRLFSRGTLMSARGNSGVILSQFVRGFAESVQGKSALLTGDLLTAMEGGVHCAYQAVFQPVEGTVLTVMREATEKLRSSTYSDFSEGFALLIEEMKHSLARTPDLLPVLKEAGVIDSGGAGFLCIFEGMEMELRGVSVDDSEAADEPILTAAPTATAFGPDSVLEFGYCTEFILQLLRAKIEPSAFRLSEMTEYLETVGNSIVAVQDGDLVKIHVHTFEPENVMAFARRYGEFVTIKIENMSVQHNEVMEKQREKSRFAIVAVTSGAGIAEYFREIGATAIVEGGQTQNPATEDFLRAFQSLWAEHIVVLPNNSNVVLAAQQAAGLYDKADVRVLPTKSIAEGYSALSMMDLSCESVEELIAGMSAYLGGVTACSVTTATRDTHWDGLSIRKGDYIGLDNETIRSCATDKVTAAIELLQNLPDIDEKQVVTVFVGADATSEEADALQEALAERFPLLETGFVSGGQEVYCFLLCVE